MPRGFRGQVALHRQRSPAHTADSGLLFLKLPVVGVFTSPKWAHATNQGCHPWGNFVHHQQVTTGPVLIGEPRHGCRRGGSGPRPEGPIRIEISEGQCRICVSIQDQNMGKTWGQDELHNLGDLEQNENSRFLIQKAGKNVS